MCGNYFDGELLNGYTTIFGETSFTNMGVTLVKATNNYIYDEVSKSIKVLFPHVMIDQNRLEKWVKLCLKLENIPESEIIDMASLKKITDLEHQLALTEKALELACEELYNTDSISICAYCPYDIEDGCADECPENIKILEKYFKTKAKEMMKSE